jgi:hypothetical protein
MRQSQYGVFGFSFLAVIIAVAVYALAGDDIELKMYDGMKEKRTDLTDSRGGEDIYYES